MGMSKSSGRKEQFSAWAPEAARIVDTDGQVLAEYNVDDLAEDTGRRVADHPPTTSLALPT